MNQFKHLKQFSVRLLGICLFLFAGLALQAQEDTNKVVLPDSNNYSFSEDSLKMISLFEKQKAETKYNEGVKHLHLKEYAQAIECFNEALNYLSDFADGYYNRALAYIEINDTTMAIADLDKTISIKPSADAYFSRFLIRYEGGNKSKDDLLRALMENEYHYLANYYLGLFYFKEAKYNEAIKAYSKCLDVKTDFAMAYHDRGSAYRMLGDAKSAMEDYRKAIKYDAGMSIAWKNLAAVQKQKGNLVEAKQTCLKAISIDDTDKNLLLDLSVIYFNLENYDSCIFYATKAIEIDASFAYAYNSRGSAYYKKQLYRDAHNDFTSAITIKDDYGYAYLNRGIVNEMLKDDASACEDWSKAYEFGVESAKTYLEYVCGK